ncbi:hypothetical protein Pla110_43760 [Polystyrenella longa]|uniref:Integrase catalytic domain-containing protein n=1 Tax=Polystyrenella longa TaxID=2528007 RepID=A0A518CTS3_9PLAN|nr:hypothetical protein Pla110_43760 [Polystyrenella longa]
MLTEEDHLSQALRFHTSHESFNGKLRDELLDGEIFNTLLEAKVLIERWRKEYNTIRPHSSLGYRAPVPETKLLYPPDTVEH